MHNATQTTRNDIQTRTHSQTQIQMKRLSSNFRKGFVLPRSLVMAAMASKRSLRERVLAAGNAEQPETPLSSEGSDSVAAGSSSSVRNNVRSATKRRIEVLDGVADIGEPSSRDKRQPTLR